MARLAQVPHRQCGALPSSLHDQQAILSAPHGRGLNMTVIMVLIVDVFMVGKHPAQTPETNPL
jgi:hypothetical protein